MSNMSYCRFENTSKDVADCLEALNNYWDLEDLSRFEISGLRDLLDQAKEIVELEDLIIEIINKYKDEYSF